MILAFLLLIGCGMFITGINWGLPSRSTDRFLFGSADAAWPARKIQDAAGPWTPAANRASDVDQNPLGTISRPVILNQTPARQAEIIRRFRLFSHQPDEAVTFMALARMKAGNLDPGMYQYGGLWIYPVGACLKLASMAGLVHLTGDLNYYLDTPEQFGRFYIVARLYSAMWGLIGIWVVYQLARRLTADGAGLLLPAAAAACFCLMPVIVNAAHEAKPHLGGAVLVLLTVLGATKFLETRRTRYCIFAGIACGASAAMVLSGAVAAIVVFLMILLARDSWRRRLTVFAGAAAIAFAVFALTNPHLLINLLRNPAIVKSNLGTLSKSKAVGGSIDLPRAIPNAASLIAEGASPILAVAGTCAAIFLLVNRRQNKSPDDNTNPWQYAPLILLAGPTLLILVQFTILAADKSGEYGRFAILPNTFLLLATIAAVHRLIAQPIARFIAAEALVVAVGFFGLCYLASFVENRTRMSAARRLELHGAVTRTIGIRAEPAPYNLPPIDITRWRIVLLPDSSEIPSGNDRPGVIVLPIDNPSRPSPPPAPDYKRLTVTGDWTLVPTRISWADKPFEIWIRQTSP